MSTPEPFTIHGLAPTFTIHGLTPLSQAWPRFPRYANSNGAVGVYQFDSTSLSNGLHTISWVARDDAGEFQGVGSRFFAVQN